MRLMGCRDYMEIGAIMLVVLVVSWVAIGFLDQALKGVTCK